MQPSDLTFHPPFIAHRGARAAAPENTLASIRRACAEGAMWVEFDVKLTQDGVPILMHDDTLERTTNGAGRVAETDWVQIETLDGGGAFGEAFKGEKVPRLADALRCALECGLRPNIEIKPCKGRAKATAMVALMTAALVWPQEQPPPLVSSFDEETLAIAAQLQPHWPRSFAFEEWRDDWHKAASFIGAEALTVDETLLTPERLRILTQADYALLAFTVNDPKRMRDLLRQGVTAVFCDNPGALIATL
ncbi:MAG TPA: glycerophosphodiester phosphodiesterase family protein [Alphaproteobacteria bacterium]|nr:glycerophosphodiester phosphodiesterase family protein [Alphaproteobacteria bacterium]